MYLDLIQWLQSMAKLGALLPRAVADALANDGLSYVQRDYLRGEARCTAAALKETADRLEAMLAEEAKKAA